MSTKPKGKHRLADVIANAVRMMQIATSETDEACEGQTYDGKDKVA